MPTTGPGLLCQPTCSPNSTGVPCAPAACRPAPAAVVCCVPQAAAPNPPFWICADYLLWWVKDSPINTPLLTSGPLTDTVPGALGQPGTTVLLGGRDLDPGVFSGWRVGVGMWLDADSVWGVEASGFGLDQRSGKFTATSDTSGTPPLVRPFFDVTAGSEAAFIIAFPGAATGGMTATGRTQVWNAEANLLYSISRDRGLQASLLAGFRYLNLDESLDIRERFTPLNDSFTFLGGPVPAGVLITTIDRFATNNDFYGGQVGGRIDWTGDVLSLGVVGKLALGCTRQTVVREGSSQLGGMPTPGGVLVVGSNIGRQSDDRFSVMPEVGVNIGCQVTAWLRVHVGYTWLYLSDVVRPGDQIDRMINPQLVPTDGAFGQPGGPLQPGSAINRSDFWVHGLNFGAEIRF